MKKLISSSKKFLFGLALLIAAFSADAKLVSTSEKATALLPNRALNQALSYFNLYKDQFKNQRFLVIIDFSQHSLEKRFFLYDLKTKNIESFRVAHGEGSDQNDDGHAERFSNIEGSKASSLGFYRTLDTYSGRFGYSLKLQGLSPTNSNAYDRAIVIHSGEFVDETSNKTFLTWGCPAVDTKFHRYIINRIKKGALIYAWSGQ